MERKRFTIPHVTDKEPIKKEEPIVINNEPKPYIDKSEQFVSSIYGSKVKDVNCYPQAEFNNNGKQYQYLKDGHKINPEDLKDYCVPKQEDFYGYGPMSNGQVQDSQVTNQEEQLDKVEQEEIKTYNNNQNNNLNQIPTPVVNYENQVSQNNIYQDRGLQEHISPNGEKSFINPNYTNLNPSVNPYQDLADDANKMNNENKNAIDDFTKKPINSVSNMQKPAQNSKIEQYKCLKSERKSAYTFPSFNLLKRRNPNALTNMDGVETQKQIIEETMSQFGIGGRVVAFQKGPTVTLFEVQLDPGVKLNRITGIRDNLQCNLAAISLRMQVPIPGKPTIGIEVPNLSRDMVMFGDMISEQNYYKDGNPLNVILGMDVSGDPIYLNIIEMPHALVAGCTKSGKSVCINSIITSIIYKAHPDDVKLILIDPKKVEFAKYNGLPHLATPVITDPKLAVATLRWLVDEMENRYDFLSSIGATNFQEYLEMQRNSIDTKHIPYLVLIIDEFADLMNNGGKEVEDRISILAAKARAAGIHIIIATQRPSVDVISGTIKSNIPTRIAFKVQKALDSSIILDKSGAEQLLGNGDMIYYNDMGKECRIQGAFISTDEVKAVVNSISSGNVKYIFTQEELVEQAIQAEENDVTGDANFAEVARYIVQTNNASINKLQGIFHMSFNRAQAIVEKLAELGVVSGNCGSKARSVLMDPDDLEDILARL